MRKITKGTGPASLTDWKRAHPTGRYDDLTETERQDIRDACAKEQFYLCANALSSAHLPLKTTKPPEGGHCSQR
ncbi:hypothetical protein MRO89_14920 [Dickeya dianthicola]|uniref:hypothetical protein n=1 Tax=Dickeya dianthicola TaxID=204039 RepID=UPI001F614676|nr:hypothetical protein [Dickeya dianthicola]MCI4187242.1 hypothetical protein [Dickeya dianthicola]